jgi:hypothetical protein
MPFEFLAAETENPILSISRRLQNSPGLTVQDLLIYFGIGATIGLLVLILSFVGRALGWWSRHSSALLFSELCGVHGLSAVSRSLLRKLIKAHKLPDQALIFLMPEKFDSANLPAPLRKRSAEFDKLRTELFGKAM